MDEWNRPLRNLDDARKYFCAMDCSSFHMGREYPDRGDEFRAMRIPKETQISWARSHFAGMLNELNAGKTDAGPLWWQLSRLANLIEIIRHLDLLREFCDATDRLVGKAEPQTRILIAHALVGNGYDPCKWNPIALAHELGDGELARRLAALVPAFCDASAAPEGGPPIDQRKSDVLARLDTLRQRLSL